jgi:hypothetical protein
MMVSWQKKIIRITLLKKNQDDILKKWGCDLFNRKIDTLPLHVIAEITYELQKAATLDAMRIIEEERRTQESNRNYVRGAGLMPAEAFKKKG